MNYDQETTVFIVEDNEDAREALCFLFDSVRLKTETYPSADEFIKHYEPERLGCLIVDVRMPGISGLELHKELIAQNALIPIIIITAHADVPMAVRAMKAGAFDFLEKPVNDELLLKRVRQAIEYDKRRRQEECKRQQLLERLEQLTPREYEVMKKLLQGNSTKVIAYDLKISHKTVESHRGQIMKKMQAKNVAELVRIGMGCERIIKM
ncbi:MAG: response regulator [Pseudomonadota bacterium]